MNRRLSSALFRRLLPCCLGLLVFASVSHAQAWDSTAWVADGTVNAMARVGDTLYVGGEFTGFAPATGALALVNMSTGDTQPSNPARPGIIRAIEPDGAGGWYMGGMFDEVGGLPRAHFAHQFANGTWDTWSPDFDDDVYSLAVRDGRLYVGGRFTRVDGQDREAFAVFDLATHSLTSLSLCLIGGGSYGPSEVDAIALTDTAIYLGGHFFTCSESYSVQCVGLVEISRATGTPTNWKLVVANTQLEYGWVHALAVSGNRLYAGGDFGSPQNPYVANTLTVFNLATHTEILEWDHGLPYEVVNAMCLDGSTLYVGGSFGVVKFDAVSGERQTWVELPPGSTVRAIRTTRSTVLLGGDFALDGEGHVRNFGIWDKTSGSLVRTCTASPNKEVLALGVGSADGLVRVGGSFTGIGGEPRFGLAAIDMRTGQPTPWTPSVPSAVYSLRIENGIAIAGTGNGIRAFDLNSGDPNPSWTIAGSAIRAMTAIDDTLYYCSSLLGYPYTTTLHAVDLNTRQATPWAPTVDSHVRALEVVGSHIYIGGFFTKINSVSYGGLVRVDRRSGALETGWRSWITAGVNAILYKGGVLYAGGNFLSIHGVPHAGLAVMDTTVGALVPGTSSLVAAGTVYSLAADGDVIHVGGSFTHLGDSLRYVYGAFSTVDLSVQPATFELGVSQPRPIVRSLLAAPEFIALGGSFRSLNYRATGNLALIRQPLITSAQTMSPATLSTPRGVMTGTCTGRVVVPGVTNAMGPAPGLVAQLGYGPATDAPSSPSWTWMNGTFSTDLSGADEWAANLTPTTAGTFAYGWRFSYAGGAWVYADLDGSANGWSAATAGVLTVTAPPVDFAVMTGPASLIVGTFHESGVVSASVWMEGVTEGWGGNADLVAQLGVGPEGEDPGTSPLWTWTNASWTGKDGGNDVYGATILPLEPGTSRYVYRFRYQNSVWKYADLDGTGNGFDPASMGTLTVFAQEPDANAQLLAPQQLVMTVGEGSRMALGHFTVMHVADPVPLMNAHFGWGPAGTRPDTSSAWTWGSVFFDPYQTGHDDWGGMVFPAPAVAGEYAYTFRFRYDGGTWSYADLDGSANGCDPAQLGRLSVSAQPTIGWSQLDTQAPVVADAGVQTPVQGLAWSWPSAGLRANAAFTADVGFGPRGTLPDVSPAWQWSPASLVEDLGDGTRHWEGLLRGTQAGEYDWCFRFRRDGGPYAYADLDGGDDGYELDAAGRFTVTGTLDAGERLPDALAFGIAGANPARGGASLRLALPNTARVRVTIHDIAGRCVAQLAEGERGAGVHLFDWRPANGAGAAVWFAQASVNGRVLTRRFVTIE